MGKHTAGQPHEILMELRQRGVKLADVARAIGVSESTVSRYQKADGLVPRKAIYDKLVSYLHSERERSFRFVEALSVSGSTVDATFARAAQLGLVATMRKYLAGNAPEIDCNWLPSTVPGALFEMPNIRDALLYVVCVKAPNQAAAMATTAHELRHVSAYLSAMADRLERSADAHACKSSAQAPSGWRHSKSSQF